MVEIRQTELFQSWMDGLSDQRAASQIAMRIARLRLGLFGDVKPVGEGVSDLRVDYGPGYRVYLIHRGRDVTVLLAGGDKRTQKRDIVRAHALAAELEKEP